MLVVSDSSTMTVGAHSMARDAAGGFVMVWEQGATNSPIASSIHIQRFNAAGKPQGSPFQVQTSDIEPLAPSVAMDAAGDFVVAWVSIGAPYQQTATYDVHAQRYDAAGIAQGGEFLVSTFADFDDLNPSVAMDAAGDFVIVWQGEHSPGGVPEPLEDYRIYARRYSAAGTALGDQFRVSDASTNENWPRVAMDAAGDFVAAWHTGDDQDLIYLAQDIRAQRYDAAGVAQGGAFPLSTAANTGRDAPNVAMDAAGRFVVAWNNIDAQSPTGQVQYDIHAQRYDAVGIPQGGEFTVNTFTTGYQSAPSVTMDAGGDFTVAWESQNQVAADSGYDVYAQHYSARGAPVSTEFRVNTSTSGSQYSPIAAMDADGDVVVAWRSYPSAAPHNSIYVRRFAGEKKLHLRLGTAFAPAAPSTGSDFSMTLAVDNASTTTPTGSIGVDAALDLGLGITASITLPADVIYRSAHGSRWTCAGPVSATLNCTYDATLAARSAASPLTLMFTAPSTPGNRSFSATVASTLKPDAGNTVNTSVNVQATGNGGGATGGASSGGGRTPSGGGGPSEPSSGGGGALDILSLALLGLLFLGRRKPWVHR